MMIEKFSIREAAWRTKDGRAIYDIFNQWSDDRCACGQEDLFDMEDRHDFEFLLDMYGISKTCKVFNSGCRYCLGGNNYEEPKPVAEEYLWKLMEDELDLNYFREAEENFGNIDYWGELVDVEAIKKLLHPEVVPETPKQKYAIRFHWHQWVDIVVEADNKEEAFEIAQDKYANGDYVEDPGNYELIDVEDLTDYYRENNIPM